jgi:hypothetical protein
VCRNCFAAVANSTSSGGGSTFDCTSLFACIFTKLYSEVSRKRISVCRANGAWQEQVLELADRWKNRVFTICFLQYLFLTVFVSLLELCIYNLFLSGFVSLLYNTFLTVLVSLLTSFVSLSRRWSISVGLKLSPGASAGITTVWIVLSRRGLKWENACTRAWVSLKWIFFRLAWNGRMLAPEHGLPWNEYSSGWPRGRIVSL